MLDLKAHFSRFLMCEQGRLHFAAHSHHPWPDVTRNAQLEAWDTAARLIDDKWDYVLGPLLDEVRRHVAGHLNLPDPATLVFAPNTHELLNRLLSCFPAGRRVRIVASDGEFHSFSRQIARLAEDGLVDPVVVAVEPFETFPDRLAEAARARADLVFVSQVFFNSGFAWEDFAALAAAAGEAMVVIDGYHGFLARPTDLSGVAGRCFYLAGGYKYAMSGEGVCFLHCPPGWAPRPRDTGWFAAFGALTASGDGRVAYPADGWRFMGATFDPTGLFRMRAAMRWLADQGLDAARIHAHARALGDRFLAALPLAGLTTERLLVDPSRHAIGNFLTFDLDGAAALYRRLHDAGILTDVRGRRLRFGFGLYQTAGDVDALIARMATLSA
ncbi:selenocysteine lyase/cysteine desulfurase [Tepidamorphus gemmatus]|jgi:kynureninase|uniref:Selenocysteine lyase/cysteine desulfurase n=1 Tax=Tepidamorphus gemmatus TaxID=747076 RepID=A0A4R3MJK8_9HYPH|nr:aminotransferase class V-fold PLP-dependent enzyme [Tepidamorphus gemmatus]TCT11935.1 selenocysteine lyase/cysteine desulfurase [Tepidamorphus gemmatus]